jgi:hypothetical protein
MKKNFRAFQVKKNGSSSWINRIIARKIFKILGKILLIDEHIVKDSHILKLNILGCDNRGGREKELPKDLCVNSKTAGTFL